MFFSSLLVVIDVQVDVVVNAVDRDPVIATIAGLVDQARASEAPVIWVQHSDDDLEFGTPGWELVPELVPADGEAVVHKQFRDSFDATDLRQILDDQGTETLVVTGSQSDYCVKSSLHGALARGFNAVLVSDAHTTEDMSDWGAPPPQQVMDHLNLYWATQQAPSAQGSVVPAAEVRFF